MSEPGRERRGNVVEASNRYGTDRHTAATAVGLERVAEASRPRAVCP